MGFRRSQADWAATCGSSGEVIGGMQAAFYVPAGSGSCLLQVEYEKSLAVTEATEEEVNK